jgi:hypothetical protein
MLFAAATDHRYLDNGHTLDFVNKALEALDVAGWERAEAVLASLPVQLAGAERMEEALAWRSPVDLVALLEDAFEQLPEAVAAGGRPRPAGAAAPHSSTPCSARSRRSRRSWTRCAQARGSSSWPQAVSFAAAMRIARFPTSNEFGDWDTALHTFTFANAVEQGLRRAPSAELLRGVFDAAVSVHLDRFLNVPPTRLPHAAPVDDPGGLLDELLGLLDRRQQVDEAARVAAGYLASGGDRSRLVATLGSALVREDRNFHTIQCVEAAVRQYELLGGGAEGEIPLLAATRYLAAHSATTRSQLQTFEIARRLHRGDRLYEDEVPPVA